ncbi:MAG: hypothetical protein AB9866_10110 [Syntrophobacteraceae bacterium]
MNKKITAFFLLVACVLFMSIPASAKLAAVGPINPVNGFPLWYQDSAGFTLDLPAPPLGDGATAPTQIFDPPVATPFSQQIGFASEAMYWSADSKIDLPGGGRALLVMALEAAFAQGDAINGDQIVFTRIRIRIDIPATGAGRTYTVKHPYGTDVFPNVTAGTRGINSTIDIGVCAGNFAGALAGSIGPFLRQLAPAPPSGWIGDGATEATATGSPTGQNIFRIEGPDIGGPGVNFVETNLFVVSGHKLATGSPLSVTTDRVSYSRNATDTTIEIFAKGNPKATVTATIPGVATPITLTPGTSTRRNSYFGRVTFPSSTPLPASITLNATLLANTATFVTGPPTDVVTITSALFDTPTGRLIVLAASSDTVANPVLTVTDPPLTNITNGQLVNGRLNTIVGAPTSQITVGSAQGGSTTVFVTSQ